MFKIGDKVKVIKATQNFPKLVGNIGIIVEVYKNEDEDNEVVYTLSFKQGIYLYNPDINLVREIKGTCPWENDETGEFYDETWCFSISEIGEDGHDILEKVIDQIEFDF